MADGFEVDLGALRRAAEGVADTLAAMATRKVSDIDASVDAFGHEDLGKTVRDFCDRWNIGVGHLAEDGREVVDRLQRATFTYEAADRNSGEDFAGIVRRLDGTDPAAR